MMTKKVYLTYLKKTDKFQYANMVIGGVRYVNDNISTLIKEGLPKKLSTKQTYSVAVVRAGKTTCYEIKVTA
jgi:hypothetical protein